MTQHPLKGRKVSSETIAKRKATWERKRKEKQLLQKQRSGKSGIVPLPDNMKDALAFLRKAERAILRDRYNSSLTDAEIYVLCAKRCLEGGMR